MQITFAATAGIVALSLVAVAFDHHSRPTLVALAIAVGLGAVAAWVVFGLRPRTSLAVVAGGMTVAFAAEVVALKLRDLRRAAGRVDDQLARAQARLNSLIAREAEERSAELERTLVRARADSSSLLAEQERRFAEERRVAALERSRAATDELGQALS